MNADSGALSLVELYERTHVSPAVLIEWVEVGWLCPLNVEDRPDDHDAWRFPPEALAQVRAALRLARELDLEPDVAALVHELIRERQAAEQRLARVLRLLEGD